MPDLRSQVSPNSRTSWLCESTYPSKTTRTHVSPVGTGSSSYRSHHRSESNHRSVFDSTSDRYSDRNLSTDDISTRVQNVQETKTSLMPLCLLTTIAIP